MLLPDVLRPRTPQPGTPTFTRYDLRERETSSQSSRDPGSRLAGSVSFRVDRRKLHNDSHEQTEIGNNVLECDWVVLFEPGSTTRRSKMHDSYAC